MPTPPVSRASSPSPPPSESSNEGGAGSASSSTPPRSRSPSPEAGLNGLTARGAESGHEFNAAEFVMRTRQVFQALEPQPDLQPQPMAEIRQAAGRPSPVLQPEEPAPAQIVIRSVGGYSWASGRENVTDYIENHGAAFEFDIRAPLPYRGQAVSPSIFSPRSSDPLGDNNRLVRQHPIGFQTTTAPAPPPISREVLTAAMTALDELDANDTTRFRLPDQHRLAGEVLMRAYNSNMDHAKHEERPTDSVFLRGEKPSTDPEQLLQQVIYDVRSWSEPMPPTFSVTERVRHAAQDVRTAVRGIQERTSQFIRQHNFLRRGN